MSKAPIKSSSAASHFGGGAAIVLTVAVLCYLLEGSALLRSLNMVNLDVLFATQPVLENADVAVVAITDEDYKNKDLFNGISPLSPATVGDLIAACVRSGAKVIAIDLDTSDWAKYDRIGVRAKIASEKDTSPPLVWAVGGYPAESGNVDRTKPPAWRLDKLNELEPDCQGIPASVPDQYGVVRGYLPTVDDEIGGTKMAVGNLAVVAVQLAEPDSSRCHEPSFSQMPKHKSLHGESDFKYINFSGGRPHYPQLTAQTVINASKKVSGQTNPWLTSNPLQGRIVIIGGAYRAARDQYVTPAGLFYGADILAQTIASMDKQIEEPTHAQFFLNDILLGLSLLTASWFLRPPWAPTLSFLVVPLLAIVASYVAFSKWNYFISIVPILAAIILHRLIEFVHEHRAMAQEIRVLKNEKGALEEDNRSKTRENQVLAKDIGVLAEDVRTLTEENRSKELQLEEFGRLYGSSVLPRESATTASSTPPDPGPLL